MRSERHLGARREPTGHIELDILDRSAWEGSCHLMLFNNAWLIEAEDMSALSKFECQLFGGVSNARQSLLRDCQVIGRSAAPENRAVT